MPDDGVVWTKDIKTYLKKAIDRLTIVVKSSDGPNAMFHACQSTFGPKLQGSVVLSTRIGMNAVIPLRIHLMACVVLYNPSKSTKRCGFDEERACMLMKEQLVSRALCKMDGVLARCYDMRSNTSVNDKLVTDIGQAREGVLAMKEDVLVRLNHHPSLLVMLYDVNGDVLLHHVVWQSQSSHVDNVWPVQSNAPMTNAPIQIDQTTRNSNKVNGYPFIMVIMVCSSVLVAISLTLVTTLM